MHGQPSLSNDKGVLINEVASHFRDIMLARSNRRPVVPSFVYGLPLSFAPCCAPCCVARSSGGSHKAVGTDTPAMVTSYIGSEEAADNDRLLTNTLNQTIIINDLATCAAAPVEVVADDAQDEVEYMMSAACAGEDVPEDACPDRWAALSNEITAKAKGRGKATKTTKEPKEKAPPT